MTLPEKLQTMATGPAALEPANPDEIRLVEEELGFTLPADYTEFMRRSNGFNIDVDPVIQDQFRLYPIDSIIDESHGFDHDVREEQIVVIGTDGVDNAFAIDFKSDPAQFVKFNHHGRGRSSFIYLGETLEQFVDNVLAGNQLKKPRGLAKRKKAKLRPDKVDKNRKPDDPGLAMVLREHDSQCLNPYTYIAEYGVFVFSSHSGTHTLEPESGETKPLPGEAGRLYMPAIFDSQHSALVGACFDHEQHEYAIRSFDFETGERVGDFDTDTLLASYSLPWSIRFSHDGRQLIAVCRDHRTLESFTPGIIVFDRESRQLLQRYGSWGNNTTGVTFTSDGRMVHGQQRLDGEKLPCPVYHDIVHRSVLTGEVHKTITLPGSFYEYFWLRMTASGRLFAIRQDFMVCEIHDDGSVTQPFGPRRVAEWNSMELIGDDRLLLGTGAGSLHLLDIETGKQVWSVRHRRGCCSTLAVSEDLKWLLTGGGEAGPPRLWRLPN